MHNTSTIATFPIFYRIGLVKTFTCRIDNKLLTLDLSRSLLPRDNNDSDYVEEIYLQDNIITIPVWIFQIVHLKFLHLADNKIIYIPEEISLLTNLEFFDVSGNLIEEVPATIGDLKCLKVLNISKNLIKVLPRDVGKLKCLEVLVADQNLITYIPDELGDCKCLTEFSFDDNLLINRIPARIFSLHHLKSVFIDRCSIFHLPYIKCVTLTTLRVCENFLLTHIPYYYEAFITDDYAHQTFFNLTEPLNDVSLHQIETVKDNRIIALPDQLTTIYGSDTRQPLTLFQLCLSTTHQLIGYNNILKGLLPSPISRLLKVGPVARCGGAFCNIYLFRESYVLLLRRNHGRNDHAIISHLFCSKDCLDKWFDDKTYFYSKVQWKFIRFPKI